MLRASRLCSSASATSPAAAAAAATAAAAAASAPAFTSFENLFSGTLAACPGEVAAYGACLDRNLQALDRGVCAREFAALRTCSDAQLQRLRLAKGR
jgi:hypothetical protein